MQGFSVGKAEKKLGICASSTCSLNLDHVKVQTASLSWFHVAASIYLI